MKVIKLRTTFGKAIDEWMRKERGSFEDYDYSPSHVYALLKRFGGVVTLTEEEARTILVSADYQQSWDDDDIQGGARAKATIKRYADKIESLLKCQ
jgi:hypothetical protein